VPFSIIDHEGHPPRAQKAAQPKKVIASRKSQREHHILVRREGAMATGRHAERVLEDFIEMPLVDAGSCCKDNLTDYDGRASSRVISATSA
jgi:hypothetical protein